MNLEKVFFAFFIVLALTLNFGFFIGDLDDPNHHNVYELFAALVVSLIATIMKFGDRAHIGAVLLATSLVADLQLIAAVIVWGIFVHATDTGLTPMVMSSLDICLAILSCRSTGFPIMPLSSRAVKPSSAMNLS